MYPFACDIPARILFWRFGKVLCVGAACLPSRAEERLQDSGAFIRQNARGHVHAMIQPRVIENLEAGSNGAALRIIAAVNQAWHSRLNHCA